MASTSATLRDEFAKVGIDLRDVCRDPAPQLDVGSFNDGARVLLVVTTYLKNADGKLYMDTETGQVATQVRHFPVRVEMEI